MSISTRSETSKVSGILEAVCSAAIRITSTRASRPLKPSSAKSYPSDDGARDFGICFEVDSVTIFGRFSGLDKIELSLLETKSCRFLNETRQPTQSFTATWRHARLCLPYSAGYGVLSGADRGFFPEPAIELSRLRKLRGSLALALAPNPD